MVDKRSYTLKSFNSSHIIFLLFAIMPIAPYWFKIANINISYILCTLGCIVMLGLRNYRIKLHVNVTFFLILQAIVIRIFQHFINGNYKTVVMYSFTTLIFGILVIHYVSNRKIFLKLIDLLVYISGIISILGIIEEITHFNFFSLFNTTDANLNYNVLRFGILRILSFSSHTIAYCIYTMFLASLTFYTISVNKKNVKVKKTIYFLLLCNSVMTLSRSAIIVLIVSQFGLLYFYGGFKRVVIVGLKLAILSVIGVGIFSVLNKKILYMVQSMTYMIIAVFNSKYRSIISTNFGGDNLSAFGNRLDLYGWVWDSLRDSKFWGKGIGEKFNYRFYFYSDEWRVSDIKTSIEVQYLSTLFHYGIVGMVSPLRNKQHTKTNSAHCHKAQHR